jgi:hypothetical protein
MPGFIFQPLTHSLTTLSAVACDLVRLVVVIFRSRRALAAENLTIRARVNDNILSTLRLNSYTLSVKLLVQEQILGD